MIKVYREATQSSHISFVNCETEDAKIHTCNSQIVSEVLKYRLSMPSVHDEDLRDHRKRWVTVKKLKVPQIIKAL